MKVLRYFFWLCCLLGFWLNPLCGETSFVPGKRRFDYLTIRDGLSQNTVNSIFQDSRGFLWFGTQDGLNRYDGYHFKVYTNDPDTPGSLINNGIYTVYESHHQPGILWIGTTQGVCTLDVATGVFTLVGQRSPFHRQFRESTCRTILEDSLGCFWLGISDAGVFKYDVKRQVFQHFPLPLPADMGGQEGRWQPETSGSHRVNALVEDRQGNIWIGSEARGLLLLHRQSGYIRPASALLGTRPGWASGAVRALLCDRQGNLWVSVENHGLIFIKEPYQRPENTIVFNQQPLSQTGFNANNVRTLYQDRAGSIWIGTMGSGIACIPHAALKNEKTVHFLSFPDSADTLDGMPSNNIMSIHEDRAGTLWFGTRNAGIKILNANLGNFLTFRRDAEDPKGLHHSVIWSITPERDGRVWLGTDGGLYRFHLQSKEFQKIPFDPLPPSQRGYGNLLSLCHDREDNLWIATDGSGLFKYHAKTGAVNQYRTQPNNPSSLANNSVRCLIEDSQGVLWIGFNEDGLCCLYPKHRQEMKFTRFVHVPFDFSSLSSNRVFSLHEDRNGVVWVGTMGGGLNRFNRETGRFTHFRKQSGEEDSINDDIILSIYSDREGVLWIGTASGLNRYDARTSSWQHFTTRDGLANNVIYAIQEELPTGGSNNGYLWVSTNKGLSRFNRNTHQFRNYDYYDGLQSNEFTIGASTRTDAGWIIFGGINGFNLFSPSAIQDNHYVPPVVCTDFKLLGRGGAVNPELVRSAARQLAATNRLDLPHPYHSFTFEFAALNFINPEKNQYQYKLEGFDRDWISLRRREPVTYTNIPPGHYRLRVLGSNNDGVWNKKGLTIEVVIRPPFWYAWWFKLLFLLSLIGLLLALHWWAFRTRRQKWEKQRLTQAKIKQE